MNFSRPFALAAFVAGMAFNPAQATLVYMGDTQVGGTGLGTVNTVLTLRGQGGGATASGSVGVAAGGGDMIAGDAATGASQTLTRSLGDLNLASASDLRVVFNASEPGAPNLQSITLSDLRLGIYSASGTLLFDSGAFTPVTFPNPYSGTGQSGFVFGLDATQAAQAQAAGFGDMGNRIGLSATTFDSQGGLETFYVSNMAQTAPIPEPGTMALALVGVGALLARVRRQRQQD